MKKSKIIPSPLSVIILVARPIVGLILPNSSLLSVSFTVPPTFVSCGAFMKVYPIIEYIFFRKP